jgi:hypothetical protein
MQMPEAEQIEEEESSSASSSLSSEESLSQEMMSLDVGDIASSVSIPKIIPSLFVLMFRIILVNDTSKMHFLTLFIKHHIFFMFRSR